MLVPEHVRDAIVDHARAVYPEEACGLLACDSDGGVVMALATRNTAADPYRYRIDPEEHFRALQTVEGRGWTIGGIYHSHPRGPALPSAVDIASPGDPDWIHVIVSDLDEPDASVRAFRVGDGAFVEVPLDVTAP